MLEDLLRGGFGKAERYNCAERVLYGANLAYDLGLDKAACKLMAGFGGGMGVEATCGALCGAVAALSSIFVADFAHESERIKLLSQELFRRFEAERGCIDCAALKRAYRDPITGCDNIVFAVAAILDEIVSREAAARATA